MHDFLMHRKKKKKKLSCWLRLINSFTFQFFITLLFVSGKWDMRKKMDQCKASGTVFNVCFLDLQVCCDNSEKIRTSWPLAI